MTTERSFSLPTGTKLVIGLLVFATVMVIISRIYRTPPGDEAPEVLQQQGIPAARQGMDLARKGKKLLPLEEQHEMDAIYAQALQTLAPEERQRFRSLAQKGSAANDSEVTESGELMKKALRSLPPDQGQRLWALVEKAVRLQVAQEKPPAAAGQQ